jgi:hypothetical protein
MYKGKTLLNIVLAIWQLPQILLGLVMLLIFRNKTEYTNPYNGITVWNINSHGAFGTACFSTGPIIVTCSDKVEENLLRHETGHSFQSICLGWLFHIVVSIPSICLFWYRRLKHKDAEWYYAHWPESGANKRGGYGVDVNINKENSDERMA